MSSARADGRKRVVITGMGVVAPNGLGVPAFEAAIRKGESGLRHQEKMVEAKSSSTEEAADEIVN